jgi:hypothetical protein
LSDFVGDVSNYLFEFATVTDIDSLRKVIEKVEAMAETAVIDASRIRQGVASVTHLQNERLESLRGVLLDEH